MEERDSIILAYRREGLSIREIARRNGMSRKANAQGDSTEHDGKIVQNERNTRYDK